MPFKGVMNKKDKKTPAPIQKLTIKEWNPPKGDHVPFGITVHTQGCLVKVAGVRFERTTSEL